MQTPLRCTSPTGLGLVPTFYCTSPDSRCSGHAGLKAASWSPCKTFARLVETLVVSSAQVIICIAALGSASERASLFSQSQGVPSTPRPFLAHLKVSFDHYFYYLIRSRGTGLLCDPGQAAVPLWVPAAPSENQRGPY